MHFFLAALFPFEIRTLALIISLKCVEFFLMMGIRLDPRQGHAGTRLRFWVV